MAMLKQKPVFEIHVVEQNPKRPTVARTTFVKNLSEEQAKDIERALRGIREVRIVRSRARKSEIKPPSDVDYDEIGSGASLP